MAWEDKFVFVLLSNSRMRFSNPCFLREKSVWGVKEIIFAINSENYNKENADIFIVLFVSKNCHG